MALYMQACGAALVAVVLILALGKQNQDMAVLLALAVCGMIGLIAMEYLEPVIDLIREMEELGMLNSSMVRILLKAAGIGVLSEIAALVCNDAGNSSLGKTVQLLGTAVILWLSVPLFTMLIELLQDILGEL